MDKTNERETRDLMNVESFSQLPFIRPAPSPVKEKGVRLFGIEFPGGSTATEESESAETTTNNNNTNFDLDSTHKEEQNNNNNSDNNNGESSSNRRFECHYCCRNFPTSQALGGHQNAHKRERQHAKRQHLHSAAMLHGGGDSHGYASHHHHQFMNNYRFSSSRMPYYPIQWNNYNSNLSSSTSGGSFYGTSYSHHHQQQQPINGSPLALWRIPTVQSSNPTFNRDRSLQHSSSPSLFASGEEMNNIMRASQVISATTAGSQNRFVYDSKTNVHHDHMSLDLHL